MSLVRRLRGSENFRTNRLSAVPKSDDDFWRKVLHRLTRSLRERAGRGCHILHGLGTAEVNSSRHRHGSHGDHRRRK